MKLRAVVVTLLLLAVATVRLGPRLYNRHRLQQLSGRHVYDEKADAAALLKAGLARAGTEHKRVLVIMGGNWCQWCLALDDLMASDEEIHRFVSERFVLVKLDAGAAEALDDGWGQPSLKGVPVLLFLDADGKVAHIQESVSLERFGGRLLGHDRDRLFAILRQWA